MSKFDTNCYTWIYFVIVVLLVPAIVSARECDSLEWKCKNGQCIASDELCDGEAQCRDKSDETAESCVHVICPSFSYRCAYGACVSAGAECNGISECFDNSDETSVLCPGVLERLDLRGNCSEEYVQCNSGECISLDELCDGVGDCADGSDETVERCSLTKCPDFAFRCGYGACVKGNSKCDGKKDCFDGSDEATSLCGTSLIQDTSTTGSFLIEKTTTTTTTSRPIYSSSNDCLLPKRSHLHTAYMPFSANSRKYHSGEYIKDKVSVEYKCDNLYTLEGTRRNFCLNGSWVFETPQCLKYCQHRILSGITYKSDCFLGDYSVSCKSNLKPGTIARISCQVGYQKPDRQVTETIRCGDDGEWDHLPFKCEQICGDVLAETTPFLVGGETVNITKVPWHVGIYSKQDDLYQQKCGGTIINAKVIISAAHCFWDTSYNTVHDKSKFAIGVGKNFRLYDQKEPLLAQYFNISELVIPTDYLDSEQFYQNDIAIIVLNNHIRFNDHTRPICIEWLPSNNRAVPSGSLGRVAGWGKDERNTPSDFLKVVDLPSVGTEECLRKSAQHYKQFVTGDKFCVDNFNGDAVCDGDSGGGFTTSKLIGGKSISYLTGIVSTGLKPRGDCSGNILTTFTNIQYHSRVIAQYETKYRHFVY